MQEQQPFYNFQDYQELGTDPIVNFVATKWFLLDEVPNTSDLNIKEHLVNIAEITFGSGLEGLLLKGVKPQTIKNSTDIRIISFLLRFSQAEIDALKDLAGKNLTQASDNLKELVGRGVSIPSIVIERVEQSAIAPSFRTTLQDLITPADLSDYQQIGKGLIHSLGL